MKILQVFDFFSPAHGGGTIDIMHKLSKTLVQKGHEVVICTSDFELDQNFIDSLNGVKIHMVHNWFNFSGLYVMPGLLKFDITSFDVIHLQCYRSFQNIILCRNARKYGIPYIIDAHGSTENLMGMKQILKQLYDNAFGYKTLRDASRVVAETEVGVNEFKQLGVDSSKIAIIHPPFDIGEFVQLPQKGQFRSQYNIKEKHIVLFLSRINWVKGLAFLVNSFYELCKVRDDVLLVIVGSDDGYKSTLVHMIKTLNLSSKVLFTGFLSGKNKLAAYVDADLLVQSSMYEQGARPSFEAIMCNTPVIATKNTGAGEDIKKIDAGYLVDYDNVQELSLAMQYVLDNPAIAQLKTQRAKEWIKNNLSLERQVDKYEELYKKVAA